jgi:hypothetical protein
MTNQEAQARYLEIKKQYGSRAYGKCWKPSTPLSIKIEMEAIVKQLTRK